MTGPPAWLVGVAAGLVALIVLGFDLALFASGGGLLFAAIGAFWFGAGVAALIEPARQGRNALIVAFAIVASLSWFLLVRSQAPPPPGTSYGGPNVLPPH